MDSGFFEEDNDMAITGLRNGYDEQNEFRQKLREKCKDEKENRTSDFMQQIRDKKEEILEKVKKGDTEPSFQIGSQSFTQKEWDKLLKAFDGPEEETKKEARAGDEAVSAGEQLWQLMRQKEKNIP
jgi:flagellar biosynthesis regulator FlaF